MVMDGMSAEINNRNAADDDAIAEQLLRYVQNAAQDPALAYAEPPRRISGGFETAIFCFRLAGAPPPFAGPLVLRLFHASRASEPALREAAVQNALAALGYPAPSVFAVEAAPSPLGGAFLIMEWLPGRLLGVAFEGLGEGRSAAAILRLLFAFPSEMRRFVALWCEAVRHLHALPVADFARALEPSGRATETFSLDAQLQMMAQRVAKTHLQGLAPGLAWLGVQRPRAAAQVLCHGDLHPFNLLVAKGRIAGVIDWGNLTIADPALDLGAILALAATIPFAAPLLLRPVVRGAMRTITRALLRAYRRARPVDARSLRYFQVYCCLRQLMWIGECRAAGHPLTGGFGAPGGVKNLIAHIRRTAGIAVDLPR